MGGGAVLVLLALVCAPRVCSAAEDVADPSAVAGAESAVRKSDTQGETAATPEPAGRTVTLAFRDVPVVTLAQFFHELTGKEFLVEGGWSDRVDLTAGRRLSVDEAEQMFVSAVESLGYRAASEGRTVRIIAPVIRAVQVEGAVVSLPSEPLTRGERETFHALCSGAASWISIRAPEHACGLSWARQSPGGGFVFLPWIRRVRKVDDRMWVAGNQFGLPVSLRELFDVVCETGAAPPEHARLITIDRRAATEVVRDDAFLVGLIHSVDKLGCSDQAGTPASDGVN
jgi:hypothetical protein